MSQPNFKNDRMRWWERMALRLQSYAIYHQAKQFDGVEKTLLFVGYPRSGHTLIGSLLDAHPNILLAHELDVLYFYGKGYSQQQIDALILANAQKFTRSGRQWMGYDYQVPGQWQGRFEQLKVIGDKSGGRTTRRLLKFNFTQLLPLLSKNNSRSTVFLHVIRNPYDVITTMMQRTSKRRMISDNEPQLRKKAAHFFQHAQGVALAKQQGYQFIDVYHEAFVRQPTQTLQSICTALGLSSNSDYLKACAELVWEQPSQSRNRTDLWTEENTEWVRQQMAAFPWFEDYTFSE